MNRGLSHGHAHARESKVSPEARTHQSGRSARRLALQDAVATLSARLLDCPPQRAWRATEESLRTLGQCLPADRSSLWLLDADGRSLECRASWRASPSIPNCPDERVPLAALPWLTERLGKFQSVRIGSLGQLPKQAAAERAHLEARGVRSCAFVPLVIHGSLRGLLRFENCRCEHILPREQMVLLRIAADLLAALLERAHAEDLARRTRERLARTQRLEAVGRMTSGIAHDFNNLLTAILGYSELLEEELGEFDPRCEEVREVQQAAGRASKLVEQILSFTRRAPGPVRSIDLNRTVADLEHLLRRLLGDDIDLEIRLDRDLPQVRMDPCRLEQVLVNLTVNAREAMPEGGRLRIVSRTQLLDPRAAGRLYGGALRPGRYVSLEVSDDGIGMDERTRRQLFEPFFTTRSSKGGSGLGLATVATIVAECEGHIRVSSEPGCGASFEILLPEAEADPTQPGFD